jgi:hypothetical protein
MRDLRFDITADQPAADASRSASSARFSWVTVNRLVGHAHLRFVARDPGVRGLAYVPPTLAA